MFLELTLVFASLRMTEPANVLQPNLPELEKAEPMNAIFLPKVKLISRVIYVIFNVHAVHV